MFSLVNSAVNVTLPAFAAERRAAAPLLLGDRYVLPAKHSAANPPHAAAAVERWDRQTDGRTPDCYRHCSAYYAGSVNKVEYNYLELSL